MNIEHNKKIYVHKYIYEYIYVYKYTSTPYALISSILHSPRQMATLYRQQRHGCSETTYAAPTAR